MKKVPLAAAGRPDGPGPYKTNEDQYILEPRTVPGGAFSMDFHENMHFPAQNAIFPRIQYGATFCALKRNVLSNLPGGRSPFPLKYAKSCTCGVNDRISWKHCIFAVYSLFGTFTVSGPQNALNSFTFFTILAPLAPLGARRCVNHKKSMFSWF